MSPTIDPVSPVLAINTIVRVALPVPLSQSFDYLLPSHLHVDSIKMGMRVLVPFGPRRLVGIVIECVNESDFPLARLKRVFQLIDQVPIVPAEIMELCQWLSAYYHAPIGEVLKLALPTLLRSGQPAVLSCEKHYILSELGKRASLFDFKRAPKQANILARLKEAPHGLTSSQLKALDMSRQSLKILCDKEMVVMTEKAVLPMPAGLRPPATLILNSDQASALAAIKAACGQFAVLLLNGITGSGKTQVYLDSIAYVLTQGQQALVLVPEIGLTPQTIQRFEAFFNVPVVAFHSGLNERERLNAWVAVKTGQAKIVIGTRSAVFMPMQKLGLIVIDEEHDTSFKQQEGVRYQARDVAIMRARALQVPIVLGSATPSLESYYHATTGRYQHLVLPRRAGIAIAPTFQVIDVCRQPLDEGLSKTLLTAITQRLEKQEQVLVFLNRRGYAPVLMCHACAWVAECTRCDAKLTYHRKTGLLQCHHCDKTQRALIACPACHEETLMPVGVGTQRVEEALQRHFPKTNIIRIDRDSTRKKNSLNTMLNKIQSGKPAILLGTQMLAKGHHFPHVTLVAMLNVDNGLLSHDFRGIERMAQLMIQVAGRAGRDEKPGIVLLQTHHPDHPVLQQLISKGYQQFLVSLLAERSLAMLPPYGFLAVFRADAQEREFPLAFLEQIKEHVISMRFTGLKLLGPAPSPMSRKQGRHRAQLLLQAESRKILHAALSRCEAMMRTMTSARQVRWSLDVDPTDVF